MLARGFTQEQIQAALAKVRHKTYSALNLQFECDLNQFTFPNYSFYIKAYKLYNEHGTLPQSGGLLDQPAKIIEVFDVFSAIQGEEFERREKQLEKERKRASKK